MKQGGVVQEGWRLTGPVGDPTLPGAGPQCRRARMGAGGGSQEVAESHGGVQAEAVRPRPLCQAEWAGGWPTK